MRAPEFWSRDGLASTLLTPVAWGVDAAGRARRAVVRPVHASVPVICIGNLVAGGAGKTPVALAIGARLAARGAAVHFLTRGYGGRVHGPLRVEPARHGAAEVGDEALLLARVAPTWVSRDRAEGARAATGAGARVLVMDDGFQNPGLAKDLSLIVVDGAFGFGNGRVMPAGPLREDAARGLARADAVIVVGAPMDAAALAGWSGPVIGARLVPAPDAPALTGRHVVAFAGIGRPAKFFAMLEAMGCRLAGRHAFADHHPYTEAEIERLQAKASAAGAILVTTEKDHVRLPAAARGAVRTVPVVLDWADEAALDALISRLALPVMETREQ
jgi:tetraacyldisaccharide 4'-kinase